MISRIFVPYDFSKPSEKAFKKALKIAKENNASIAVVMFLMEDVFLHGSSWYDNEWATMGTNFLSKIEFKKDVKKLYKECHDAKVPLWEDTVYTTSPEKGIAKFAKDNKIDLIVMGSRGRKGWTKKIFGSVSSKIKKMKLPCELIIVEK